ncbi:MAG: hypothetical protein K2J61_04845 [Clostridia bacterium]|nr:hypothetical protein [Clostridia bacterium]
MEFDAEKIVKEMKNKNKIFVSEKHLQTEFILTAKSIEEYKNYEYIPEYPHKEFDEKTEKYVNKHIDLLVSDGKECVALEFKYVLHGGEIPIFGNRKTKLRNHSAVNIRRYQCVKDIARLENYKKTENLNCTSGYLLLITNMKYMWSGVKDGDASKQFELKDGSTLSSGPHRFTKGKDADRFCKIKTSGEYDIKYYPYYEKGESKQFKYLIVKV